MKGADLISPPSRWSADTVRRIFELDQDRVEPVPNGVPPEFLAISRKGANENGHLFFFGRLSHDKGVDLLLKAYSRLKTPRPPLLIAGEGEEKMTLLKLSDTLDIDRQVRFLPWLTHDQLAEYLSTARAVILPSRHENYSLAILASLAAGAPTISTSAGGTPELIRDGINGRLVPVNDSEALTEVIRQVLETPRQAEEMGKRAAENVKNSLTWKQSCDRFEELYDRLIDRFL